jgi:hypothetical protein
MAKVVKAEVVLRDQDIEDLKRALGVIPENINGDPYVAKVRRGEIERRRISLIKADKPAPNQSEEQELFRLCRYKASFMEDNFVTIGWALRSRITGDYHVYAEIW